MAETKKTTRKAASPKKAAAKKTTAKKSAPKKAAVKKTVAKKAAPGKVAPKKAAPKKPAVKNVSASGAKLHYSKDALLKDYNQTFHAMVIAVGLVVVFALAYFFIMAMYLGGWSHGKYKPFVERFGGEQGRVEIDYNGLKLPISGGKTIAEQQQEKAHH